MPRLEIIITRLISITADQTKTEQQRLDRMDLALGAHAELAARTMENARNELEGIRKRLANTPTNTTLLDAEAAKLAEIETLEGTLALETKRLESQRTGIIQAETEKRIALSQKEAEEAKKSFDQLYLYYRDSFFNYLDEVDKGKEEEWKRGMETANLLFEQNKRDMEDAGKKSLEDDKKQKEADIELAKIKVESMKQMGTAVLGYISIIDELSQKEVDRTQRERELFDTKIDEAQSALDTEVNLYKAGYASNVAAKQKEVADLKVQREKALRDEENARKRQHALEVASLLAQKAVDVAKIISSTAVANAKAVALSPLTFGQPWVAINTASAALGIAAAVAAVVAASAAKYAKGGWTGEGKYMDETGERMAGIVHEREFVVRKGPAHKFREVLDAINKDDRSLIFNKFNKLSPELLGGTTINNVVVENEGPNKRLDRVNEQLRQLNKKQSKEEVISIGNTTIYRKGDNIRTVRQ